MSTDHAAASSDPAADHMVAAQDLVMVHSCNRLGRTANSPHLSFTDWLLAGRRR
jgi:hypothetical protein